MNELADKQEEYDRLMTRYLEDMDEEGQIMKDLMRCKERLGEKQWQLTTIAFEIRDLRAKQ